MEIISARYDYIYEITKVYSWPRTFKWIFKEDEKKTMFSLWKKN